MCEWFSLRSSSVPKGFGLGMSGSGGRPRGRAAPSSARFASDWGGGPFGVPQARCALRSPARSDGPSLGARRPCVHGIALRPRHALGPDRSLVRARDRRWAGWALVALPRSSACGAPGIRRRRHRGARIRNRAAVYVRCFRAFGMHRRYPSHHREVRSGRAVGYVGYRACSCRPCGTSTCGGRARYLLRSTVSAFTQAGEEG
jgi:hypothetical protein